MKKPKANDWMRPTNQNAYQSMDINKVNIEINVNACKRRKRRLLLEQKYRRENWNALAY